METKQWRYECQKCGRRFSRRVSLTRHNLTLHQSVIWACTLCSAKLNSKYYLIRHVKRFHQSLKLDEGSSADKIPQLADNTVRQQDAHAGNESGVSDLIQETNQVKNDLVFQGRKNTYRVPIGIKQRRYICQKCGWKFCHNKDLYQHDQHVHQRVILDSTLLCSEKLHSKDNLKKNMKCFHTSSVLDEGLSVDNTLRQQAAPAGIPGDGSGVSSDLIQKTNFQSSRNAFVTRLERYLQGAKSMSSHLEKTKLLSFANPEVNSVQNQRITSVATVVETSEVTSIEMAEGKSVEMAEVTSVEMPEGTSVEMAEGTSVGIVQSQDNSVVDAKHRASDNKRTPEDNGAEYQVSKKRCLVDITLDQKAMASSDNSRDFISQKKAPPSKAQVSKESKPQSSSFQPQMLFGKPIAPSEPVFGSSFASASAVAEASPSKAEVSKESRPETPPSKAEVSKESKPQSSSFQPQMLFDKPIAPSEQKMIDEQKFSDNPSAAASRENVFRPENEQIDLNNPFDVIERVFQLTGKTAMTTDALCAEMNHFFHIVWSRFRKEYGSYLTFIKKHSNVFDLNGKIISLRGHKNTNEMEVQHDDISKKNPMGRHVEGLQCCSICGQRFFTLVGLRNHQRNHHPENASASRSETEAGSNSNSIIVIQFNQQATEVEVESLVTSAGKIVDHEFRRDDADRLTGVAHFQFAEPESVEKALSLDKEQIHGIPVIIRKSVVNSMEELRKHIANKSDTADEEQFAFIIFIKFAQHATKDQVINFFSPAGQIVETEFLRNSQGLTGYAYIRFADPQSVENALMLGNGTLLDKPVQIKKSNLKSMRISKRKYPSQETAGKDDNDLELTTSKQSEKTPDSSCCIIIIKCQKDATEKDVKQFLSSAGKITETKFPLVSDASKERLAYIRFDNPASVEKALSLGNEKLLGNPVYIRKSNLKSLNCLRKTNPDQEGSALGRISRKDVTKSQSDIRKDDNSQKIAQSEMSADVEEDSTCIVFVKYNNFVTDDQLEEFLSSAGQIAEHEIVHDFNGPKGIAYIRYENAQSVENVLTLNNQKLFGHPVMIKKSLVKKINCRPINNRNRVSSTVSNENTKLRNKGLKMESNNDDSLKISTLDSSSNLADHPQKNSDVEKVLPKKQDDVMTPDSTVPEIHPIPTTEEMEDWHGRLWIQDLDCRVKSSDLWELFEPFGELEFATVNKLDPHGSKTQDRYNPKTSASVRFCSRDDANRAIQLLNGIKMYDIPISIKKVPGPGDPTELWLAEKRKKAVALSSVETENLDNLVTSRFLLATNVFDVQGSKEPGWDLALCREILDRSSSCGAGLVHIYIDPVSPQGSVYMKCYDLKSAEMIVHYLQTDQRKIQLDCLPAALYYHLFPNSESAVKLLDRFAFALPPVWPMPKY